MRVLIRDIPNRPHAQAGQVLDLPDLEAKDLIARGHAAIAPDAPVEPVAPVDLEPAEPAKKAKKAKKAK